MYLAELLMRNELETLSAEMDKGTSHLNDLNSAQYSVYNESAITRLQNKITAISQDFKDLFLESYVGTLQDIARSLELTNEKEYRYNSLLIKLEREIVVYRNRIARYIQLNFTVPETCVLFV